MRQFCQKRDHSSWIGVARTSIGSFQEARTIEKLTSHKSDIHPLFTERDIRAMSKAFNLASYDDVKAHAAAIYDRIRGIVSGTLGGQLLCPFGLQARPAPMETDLELCSPLKRTAGSGARFFMTIASLIRVALLLIQKRTCCS